ncbi:AAA family ATPase, partial [Hugenholtzia roseola]
MNHNLPKLPLGEQDFAQMRNKEMVYVDKTNFIYQLFFVRQE